VKSIVGFGAGGHARVLIDIIELGGLFRLTALVDPGRVGERVKGLEVEPNDDLLALKARGITSAFIAVGGAGDNKPRRTLFDKVSGAGFHIPVLAHPSAVIARDVNRPQGLYVMANAVLNPGVTVGDDVIVNTGAVVDHDCIIASHVHVATGARLTGSVRVGEGAHIGAGAVVRQGISIGAWSIIGAGAVVVTDVLDGETVIGVPARPMRERKSND
jgi:UDP-perosamine 4-acetyltransferase